MTILLLALVALALPGFAGQSPLKAQQIHSIVGEPMRFERDPPADRRLAVASWNIAQGVRYERIREVLRQIDADIYLLQEVDMGVRRSQYRDVAKALADDLGMNWVFAGEFQELGQAREQSAALTGQAVLSRYPIYGAVALPFENQARFRWTLDPFQPRRGGRMALRVESGGMLLYNAHIESAKNDAFRHKQIDEMLFDYRTGARPGQPVMFAGDFNTEQPPDKSPVVRCLTEEGFVDALGPSGLARRTSVAHADPLDWIFVRNMIPERGQVVQAEHASDHFPLTARVTLPAPATAAPMASVRR